MDITSIRGNKWMKNRKNDRVVLTRLTAHKNVPRTSTAFRFKMS